MYKDSQLSEAPCGMQGEVRRRRERRGRFRGPKLHTEEL